MMFISMGTSFFILLKSWDNFTAGIDTFQEQLQNATRDLQDFRFTLSNENQRIELVVDYKTEAYQDSVLFAMHEEYTCYFVDFVLSELVTKEEQRLDSIINGTYIQDNKITLIQYGLQESHIKQQGFWEKYGLWAGIGIGGGAAALVVVVVIWRKKKIGSFY